MYESSTNDSQPLSGITVIDITQVLAGPFGTMVLGDLGADIIKIEPPDRGDRSRKIQPIPEYFDSVNRNKRSITVDLKSESGQRIVKRLVRDSDVLIESTKPGRMEEFNLAYQDLEELNSELIYCTITGFGKDSPYEDIGAWDILIQGMSGAMSMTGQEKGPPLWSGLPSGDLIAGMYAIQSVLTALYARETGQIDSERIEVPMFDTAISWLTIRAGYTFGTGEAFPRLGTYHPSMAPFGIFECQDDSLVIAAGTDSLWQHFCEAINRGELVDDPRFNSIDARVANRAELRSTIESILSKKPRLEWMDSFHENQVPAGPIYTTKSVWEDEHVKQRNLHRKMERENQEDADVIDHPVRFQNLDSRFTRSPEQLGRSTESVLQEFNYSSEEIRKFREEGVID